MARLPSEFRKSSEIAVNFDFFDIANGTGINIMYPGIVNTLGISGGILLGEQFYSAKAAVSASVNYNTGVSKKVGIDCDFDLNKTLTLKGKTLINFAGGVECTHGGGGSYHFFGQAILKKVKDGVETEVLTLSGAVINQTLGSGGTRFFYDAIGGTIPKTKFNKGETLRLTMELWGKTDSTGVSTTSAIGLDPQNRGTTNEDNIDFGSNRTDSKFFMPIEIDE